MTEFGSKLGLLYDNFTIFTWIVEIFSILIDNPLYFLICTPISRKSETVIHVSEFSTQPFAYQTVGKMMKWQKPSRVSRCLKRSE
jgi:hypothetical protein